MALIRRLAMNTRFYRVQTLLHGLFVMLLASLIAIIPATPAFAQTLGDEDAAAVCAVVGDLDTNAPYVDTVCLAAVDAAAEEAAGWPDLDPSSLAARVRLVEAAGEEAAAWPDYDPTNIRLV
jgi:hypothetical protein